MGKPPASSAGGMSYAVLTIGAANLALCLLELAS